MILRTCFGIGSLSLVFTLSCCMVGGAEMASEPALVEVEYRVVSEEEAESESDFGYGEAVALADGAGYAPPDGRDPFPALDFVGDDDAPEATTEAPTGVYPHLKGGPLLAQADDDDSAECEEPTPEDDVTLQKVAKDLTYAKGAGDRVEIQQMVIEENLEDVDDLNDELEEILEQLRREQGLEEEEAYVSPIQEVVEPILEEDEEVEANPAYFQQQVQEALEEPEFIFPDEDDDCDEDLAAPPQDQDQDQADR